MAGVSVRGGSGNRLMAFVLGIAIGAATVSIFSGAFLWRPGLRPTGPSGSFGSVPRVVTVNVPAPPPPLILPGFASKRENLTRALPGLLPMRNRSYPGTMRGDSEEDVWDLFEELYELQFARPRRAIAAGTVGTLRTVYMTTGGEEWAVGCGWMLRHLVDAMVFAYNTNRTLVMGSVTYWYLARDACPLQSYRCFLEPISALEDASGPWFDPSDWVQTATDSTLRVRFGGVPTHAEFAQCRTCQDIRVESPHLPWKYRRHGRMWLKSQMLRFLLRPRPHLQAEVEASLAQFPSTVPVVGMHIRRGDKVKGPIAEAHYHSLREYMEHVTVMRRRDGVRRVFLATDDATLGHDIKAYRTVEWIFDEDEYRVANGSGLLHQQGKDFNRTLEATNALKNILLLGECDYLVGSDRSYFFQAAWMLQFASGYLRDFASVDPYIEPYRWPFWAWP